MKREYRGCGAGRQRWSDVAIDAPVRASKVVEGAELNEIVDGRQIVRFNVLEAVPVALWPLCAPMFTGKFRNLARHIRHGAAKPAAAAQFLTLAIGFFGLMIQTPSATLA